MWKKRSHLLAPMSAMAGKNTPFRWTPECQRAFKELKRIISKEVLLSFQGVGPKCANLVLGIGCDQPNIGVDIHVHRVTNRWGYVQEKSPEHTMRALEDKLPKKYWVEINRALVPFGKHICTGNYPRCSTCNLNDMCRRIGVKKHR